MKHADIEGRVVTQDRGVIVRQALERFHDRIARRVVLFRMPPRMVFAELLAEHRHAHGLRRVPWAWRDAFRFEIENEHQSPPRMSFSSLPMTCADSSRS